MHDDELGREVKSHLIKKANDGVRVYFLYDEVGSHDLPSRYKDELRAAGVEVFDFHPRTGPRNRFQVVGDEYLGPEPKFGHWRDSHYTCDICVDTKQRNPQLRAYGKWHVGG